MELAFFILFALIWCVHADIYLYNNNSIMFKRIFEDLLCRYGPGLPFGGIEGTLDVADPPDACAPMTPVNESDVFLIVRRYGCSFEEKVRNAQKANYAAVIVFNIGSDDLLPMYYSNTSGIRIPAVFVSEDTGLLLVANAEINGTYVCIDETLHINTDMLFWFSVFVFSAFLGMLGSMCFRWMRNRRRRLRLLLPATSLDAFPAQKYDEQSLYETCVICQENFQIGDMIRILPCSHAYHAKCIDVWLTKYKRVCAICKRRVLVDPEAGDSDSDSDSEENDLSPLIRPGSISRTNGGTFSTIDIIRARIGLSPRSTTLNTTETASSSSQPNVGIVNSVNAAPDEFGDNLSTLPNGSVSQEASRRALVEALDLLNELNQLIDEVNPQDSTRRSSEGNIASETSETNIIHDDFSNVLDNQSTISSTRSEPFFSTDDTDSANLTRSALSEHSDEQSSENPNNCVVV